MISFTVGIADVPYLTYQAESGMTWADWVSSQYNTDGYQNGGSMILHQDGGQTDYLAYDYVDSEPVVPQEEQMLIEDGHNYSLIPLFE